MDIDALLSSLGAAWDRGDADAVAALFAPDAAFVDVLGRLQRGREVIAREHRALFDSIYAGSTCTFRAIAREELAADTVLVHSASLLRAPTGPRRGDTHAVQTMLVRDGVILAFHNTVQAAMERFTGEETGFGSPETAGDAAEPRDPRLT